MPLPNVTKGSARRCKARCKATGEQCKNPSAFGLAVCRYHGARRPHTVRRGKDHWNYQHGQETLEARAEHSMRLAELRELEELSYALGLAAGPKWKGRKPRPRKQIPM